MRATRSLPTCMLATSTQRYAYAARWPDTHGSYMRMRAVLLPAAAQLCSVFGRCVGMSLASCMVDESGFRSSAPAVLGRSKSVCKRTQAMEKWSSTEIMFSTESVLCARCCRSMRLTLLVSLVALGPSAASRSCGLETRSSGGGAGTAALLPLW
jgi:hypothetical protein